MNVGVDVFEVKWIVLWQVLARCITVNDVLLLVYANSWFGEAMFWLNLCTLSEYLVKKQWSKLIMWPFRLLYRKYSSNILSSVANKFKRRSIGVGIETNTDETYSLWDRLLPFEDLVISKAKKYLTASRTSRLNNFFRK